MFCMTFGSNTTKKELVFEDGTILPFAEERVVLGIKINSNLIFYSHLKQLCENVANKLNTLTRIASYLSHNQRRLMCSYFFTGQLSYCHQYGPSAPDNQSILWRNSKNELLEWYITIMINGFLNFAKCIMNLQFT